MNACSAPVPFTALHCCTGAMQGASVEAGVPLHPHGHHIATAVHCGRLEEVPAHRLGLLPGGVGEHCISLARGGPALHVAINAMAGSDPRCQETAEGQVSAML